MITINMLLMGYSFAVFYSIDRFYSDVIFICITITSNGTLLLIIIKKTRFGVGLDLKHANSGFHGNQFWKNLWEVNITGISYEIHRYHIRF